MNCEDCGARLDLFIDNQMDAVEAAEFVRHLAECPACEVLRANRVAVRTRMKNAVRQEEIPFGMGDRIHFAISRQKRSLSIGPRYLMAIAAVAVLAAGGVYLYPTLLRKFAAPVVAGKVADNSGDTYVSQVAALVAPVMQIGLAQHVHCGVLRQYPDNPPPLLEIARAKGANAGLINAVESHLPDQCRVVMAHQCSYKGRTYTHVIARGGGHLLSLLITHRNEGEDFGKDMQAAATELETPIYEGGVQSFSIDSFETSGNLVYLISDFDAARNLAMMKGMTAEVRAALL
jgi:anti-sigma factor RsiW